MIQGIIHRLQRYLVSYIIREVEVLGVSEGDTVVVYTELERADVELLDRIYRDLEGSKVARVIVCSREIRKIDSFRDLLEEEAV